jgi:Raf kinase inhibitor-like YbhB/YbcL family protein
MKLVSTAFGHQQTIPDKYTCRGANVNPSLQFLEVPEQAKSLVLLLDDPDAPAGTWVHWLVFNMDPLTLGIEENRKPTSGIEGMTSFGNTHYGGPCPPSGTHRYFFKLYALDTVLELTPAADKKAVEQAMQGHIIDTTVLMGLVSK